jgi:hypothetical protein
VPDEFAWLKREEPRGFGFAVKSCEFLWNDLEKPVVIGCAGSCRLKIALKPVLSTGLEINSKKARPKPRLPFCTSDPISRAHRP